VFHERAFDLEGTDQRSGRFDHVVGAADKPEIAMLVATREIAS